MCLRRVCCLLRFQLLDTDAGGSIDVDELLRFLQRGPAMFERAERALAGRERSNRSCEGAARQMLFDLSREILLCL